MTQQFAVFTCILTYLETGRLSPSHDVMASCLEAVCAASMPTMDSWTCWNRNGRTGYGIMGTRLDGLAYLWWQLRLGKWYADKLGQHDQGLLFLVLHLLHSSIKPSLNSYGQSGRLLCWRGLLSCRQFLWGLGGWGRGRGRGDIANRWGSL